MFICCFFSHVRLFATLWTVAHKAPLSMGFSRQEYCHAPRGALPTQGLNLCLLCLLPCRWVFYPLSHLGSPVYSCKGISIQSLKGRKFWHMGEHEWALKTLCQVEYCCGLVAKSCPTLCDPIDCSSLGSSMGFPRQEYWSGLLFPSPGNLPDPGTELMSPAWQADSLPLSHLGSL